MIVRSLYKLSLILIGSFSLFCMGCSKDIEEDEDYCLRPDYKAKVNIHLMVDESLSPYRNIIGDEVESQLTRSGEEYKLRYSVCAYPLDYSGYMAKSTVNEYYVQSTDPNVELSLPLGKYRIIAWADFISDKSGQKPYFHTDDFSDMLLVEKYQYQGCDNFKISFNGENNLTVSYKTPALNIDLSPTMGQYRLIASDLPDYEVGKIRISYPSGLPASYNLLTNEICHFWQDVSFFPIGDKYLAFDNVYSENLYNLELRVEVFDKDGKLKARRNSIKIPIKKGGVTTYTAKLFTILEEDSTDTPIDSNNGAGIDFDFGDTYIIEF